MSSNLDPVPLSKLPEPVACAARRAFDTEDRLPIVRPWGEGYALLSVPTRKVRGYTRRGWAPVEGLGQ